MLSTQDFITLAGLILALVSPIFAYMVRIRRNDLRHLDDKIDVVQATVTRIEDRLDDHVRDHATGVFK